MKNPASELSIANTLCRCGYTVPLDAGLRSSGFDYSTLADAFGGEKAQHEAKAEGTTALDGRLSKRVKRIMGGASN
jgi:hypothetical protein